MVTHVSKVFSQFGEFLIEDRLPGTVPYGTTASSYGEIVVTGPLDTSGNIGLLCNFKYRVKLPVNITPEAEIDEVTYGAAYQNASDAINRKIADLVADLDRAVQIQIRDLHAAILGEFQLHNATHADIRDDIRALKIRGVDEELGIVTRDTCDPCMSGFYGALMRNAIVQGRQVENIRREYYNPTNIVPGSI